ncbi:MAG: membrane protein [Candidatus Abyssubacteria bacterium]
MHKPEPLTIFVLLVLAVGLVYCNSLTADFIYDDYAFVRNNEAIQTMRPVSKFLLDPRTFSQPVSYHVYRPLASFSYAVNYAINHFEPAGYHIVNLLFHSFNAFLVFLVLRRIGIASPGSFAGALIFAVHPVHTEAVTWISGRGNVLFLFFFLLAYLLYTQADRVLARRRVFLVSGAVTAYAFSLLSKEMALPLPLLLLGHDLYFRREETRAWWAQRLRVYVPFLLVGIGYVVLRSFVLGKVEQVSFHGGSPWTTFLAMLEAVVIYIRLLFVPVGLSLSRHFVPHNSLLDAAVFPYFCVVVAVVCTGILTVRRAPLLSFGIFWFGVTMMPVSNIVPINAIVADRFLYGPSVAFSILAALVPATVSRLATRRVLTIFAMILLVFLHMALAIARNNEWKHADVLWLKTARVSPTSFVAFNNLGFEYMKRGRIPEAIEALNKALELQPDLFEAHVNLARCYSQAGRIEQAVEHYEKAVAQTEDAFTIRCELAALLERVGNIGDAISHYEAVVREAPDFVEAHKRLAALYATRDPVRSIDHYRTVISLAPKDALAHCHLGVLLYQQGDSPHALEFLRSCLALDPENRQAGLLLEQIQKGSGPAKISR